MKIRDCYPTPQNIFDCEVETLQFIKDNFFIYQEFSKMATDAYNYFPKAKTARNLKFEFESELQIRIEGKQGFAYLGSAIKIINANQLDDISYYVAICNNDIPQKKILRKLHFDYTSPQSPQKHPHPVFHLQYGGKLSLKLQNENLEHQHMDAWLSEPRLCFIPISLALLINLILKEFPDEINSKIIESPEWRDLIRKNENLLLAPFYKICHNFMSTRSSHQLFTNDFYYGN